MKREDVTDLILVRKLKKQLSWARLAEIVDALNNNARYLLVLQQYYDPNIGQLCEERAWVGGSFGGVHIHPLRKIRQDQKMVIHAVRLIKPWQARGVGDKKLALRVIFHQ